MPFQIVRTKEAEQERGDAGRDKREKVVMEPPEYGHRRRPRKHTS